MGPTWVLSAPGEPHVYPMNLVIRDGYPTIGKWVLSWSDQILLSYPSSYPGNIQGNLIGVRSVSVCDCGVVCHTMSHCIRLWWDLIGVQYFLKNMSISICNTTPSWFVGDQCLIHRPHNAIGLYQSCSPDCTHQGQQWEKQYGREPWPKGFPCLPGKYCPDWHA